MKHLLLPIAEAVKVETNPETRKRLQGIHGDLCVAIEEFKKDLTMENLGVIVGLHSHAQHIMKFTKPMPTPTGPMSSAGEEERKAA